MKLFAVSKLVAEHSSSPEQIQSKLDRKEREQAIVRSMFNWIMWGMIVMGIGVVLIVINKNFHIDGIFRLLGSITTITGMGVTVAGVLNAMRKGVSPPKQLSSANEPTSLPTNPIPAALPSITERTTQLIDIKKASIDRRGRE